MKVMGLNIGLLVVIAAITGCKGQVENGKIFGFLRSAEKCTKESDPEACVKRNLDGWCEKRNELLKEGTRIATVCDCIEGSPR